MRTRNLTLVLTDVKGSTERQSRSSRREIEEAIVGHRRCLQPIFEAFSGRVVKTMGDAFLVAFESPTDAVHASVQVQRALATENARLDDPEKATHVRVAISTGEVTVDDDGDVYGEPVNLAARLEGIAEAGTIYLTETTFLSMNRNEIPTLEVGYRVFKGIPDEVKVYRILDDYVEHARLLSPEEMRGLSGHATEAPATSAARRPNAPRKVVLVAVAGLVLVGGAAAFFFGRGDGGVHDAGVDRAGAPAPTTSSKGAEDDDALDLKSTNVEVALSFLKPGLRPVQLERAVKVIRAAVEDQIAAGQWDKAEDITRRALDKVPDNEFARGAHLDVLRRDLEDASKTGRARTLVAQSPPTWYQTNIEAYSERWKDVPRYRWVRATWSLMAEPARKSTLDLVTSVLSEPGEAHSSAAFRALIESASNAAASAGESAIAARYATMAKNPAIWKALDRTAPVSPGGRAAMRDGR